MGRAGRIRAAAVAASLLAASLVAAADLPLNPDVTPETIRQTICVPGWTKTVRPPAAYTAPIKRRLFEEYGLPPELMADFQLDHIIPLALGGAPTQLQNFQLMDRDEAERKDEVERCLSRSVCAGAIPLEEARRLIWVDWEKAHGRC